MGLVTLVLVSGLIAVTAGPASAVLMIPRRMEYPIGGSVFWLKGSDKELWPTKLSADNFRGCPPEQIFLNWGCPGFGFASLSDHYSKWWNRMNPQQDRVYDFQLNDGYLRKVMYVHPAAVGDRDSWVYTAHAASALIEDAMSSTHKQSVTYLQMNKPSQAPWPRNLANAEIHAYELNTKVPAVRTV